jgi:hypothetical protein
MPLAVVGAQEVAVRTVQDPQSIEHPAPQSLVHLEERLGRGLTLEVADAQAQRQLRERPFHPIPEADVLQGGTHRLHRAHELQRVLMDRRLQAGAVRDAIVDEVTVEARDATREGQRHVREVGVVRAPELLELQPVRADEVRAEQLVPRGRVEGLEQPIPRRGRREPALVRQHLQPQHPVGLGDLPGHVVVHEELAGHDVRGRGDGLAPELLQHRGEEVVIRVEEGEIVAGRLGQRQVPSRARRSASGALEDPGPRLRGREVGQNRGGRVGGAVVHQEQLEVGDALALDAGEAFA